MYSLYNNKTESGRIGKLHLAYDLPYGIVLMQINQLSLIYLEKQRIVRKYFTLARLVVQEIIIKIKENSKLALYPKISARYQRMTYSRRRYRNFTSNSKEPKKCKFFERIPKKHWICINKISSKRTIKVQNSFYTSRKPFIY